MPKAKSQKKRTRSPKKTKASSGFMGRGFRFVFTRLAVIVLIALVAGIAYLDIKIRKEFEGQKWALPAHVYTRPLEIYNGQRFDRQRVLQELTELGYQSQAGANQVGTYSETASSFSIYLRAFQFADGLRPAQKIDFNIRNGSIADMRADEGAISLVRLEPRLFGSVSPINHEDRKLLMLEDVPEGLIHALLAIEDRQFYSHFGINPIGIARALFSNISAGRIVQGGSTLTQQLVKNYYLNSERTIQRKLTEMVMAILLEVHYSKDDILQAYLNEVYLSQAGNRAIHGFELGSRYFYGRPISELNLPQLATLAGIIKGPSYYNPVRNPERALKRRNLVLKTMLEESYITQDEYDTASQQPLGVTVSKQSVAPLSYPSFLGYVRRNLEQDYQSSDLQNDGLKIYTTLNPVIQKQLETAVQQQLEQIEAQRNIEKDSLQAAAVVIRTDNGEVAAMLGSRYPRFSGYNRALLAKRPIGSLVKPFVYLTALEQPEDYNLLSRIEDKAITVSQVGSEDWEPQNYDKKEHGEVSMIDALANSYNLATVQLGMQLGVGQVSDTLQRLGHERISNPLPSLLLGSLPMSVMDVGQLYLSLASNGFRMPIKGVRNVLSKSDEALSSYPLQIEQVVETEFATLINFALQDVVRKGTARSVLHRFRYDYGLAGKTGTTDEHRDSWFAGYSGNYLAVVWVGRDDNKPTGLTGASGAARIWSAVMSKLPLQRFELAYNEELANHTVYYSEKKGSEQQSFEEQSEPNCQASRVVPVARRSLPLHNVICQHRVDELEFYEDEQHHFEPRQRKRSWFERLFN